MDTFTFRGAFKTHRALQCAYPLTGLGATAAYSTILADIPGGISGFLTEGWMPLILLGLLAWLAYEIFRTVGVLNFSVELSDGSIRVGTVVVPWSDVTDAEFKTALGRDPAIILHTRSSGDLKVPGGIEGLDYIKGVVKGHEKSHTDNS